MQWWGARAAVCSAWVSWYACFVWMGILLIPVSWCIFQVTVFKCQGVMKVTCVWVLALAHFCALMPSGSDVLRKCNYIVNSTCVWLSLFRWMGTQWLCGSPGLSCALSAILAAYGQVSVSKLLPGYQLRHWVFGLCVLFPICSVFAAIIIFFPCAHPPLPQRLKNSSTPAMWRVIVLFGSVPQCVTVKAYAFSPCSSLALCLVLNRPGLPSSIPWGSWHSSAGLSVWSRGFIAGSHFPWASLDFL